MSAAATSAATPWVERYRPQSLSDVSHQTEIISTLRNAVETDRLPHLLFYGPPGTGKTSVALALCRTLWHPSTYRRRVLELNASDERGIGVVRDKIKQFASLAVGGGGGVGDIGGGGGGGLFGRATANRKSKGKVRANREEKDEGKEKIMETTYPNPPFKVIILDEADTVTPDAQAALRRIIEAHSKVTRFILICNYVTRIIEPLASRCAKFRFQPLPPESMRDRLRYIADSERVRFVGDNNDDGDDDGNEHDGGGAGGAGGHDGNVDANDGKEAVLTEILKLSGGDMRRAVTTLQSAHALSGGVGGAVRRRDVAEMAGLPTPDVVLSLLDGIRSGSFDAMQAEVSDVVSGGWAAQHVLSALSKEVVSTSDLDELSKAELSLCLAEADMRLADGSDEVLQLLNVCSFAMRCYARSKKAKA